MRITENATLLSAESSPYNFNGNEGISHKIRVLVGGEIYPLKADAETVKAHKDLVDSEGTVTFDLLSRREQISLRFVTFEE